MCVIHGLRDASNLNPNSVRVVRFNPKLRPLGAARGRARTDAGLLHPGRVQRVRLVPATDSFLSAASRRWVTLPSPKPGATGHQPGAGNAEKTQHGWETTPSPPIGTRRGSRENTTGSPAGVTARLSEGSWDPSDASSQTRRRASSGRRHRRPGATRTQGHPGCPSPRQGEDGRQQRAWRGRGCDRHPTVLRAPSHPPPPPSQNYPVPNVRGAEAETCV